MNVTNLLRVCPFFVTFAEDLASFFSLLVMAQSSDQIRQQHSLIASYQEPEGLRMAIQALFYAIAVTVTHGCLGNAFGFEFSPYSERFSRFATGKAKESFYLGFESLSAASEQSACYVFL